MALLDNIIFISIQIGLLTFGSKKVAQLLFNDYQAPKLFQFNNPLYIPHVLFSLTLSSSCTLFLLVFSEIVHLFSNNARSLYWKFNLDILLLLVILIIPWFQFYAFFHITRGWKLKPSIYLTTILWMIYFYLFNQMNQYTTLEDTTSWIELGIIRISIIGITLISILSGFGVINTPFNTWSTYKRKVTEQDYIIAERAYNQIDSIIKEKKSLLERMQVHENELNKKDKPVKGLFNKISFIFNKSDQSEIVLLQTEIEQLEGLAINMKSDLDELERGRSKSRFSQTWKGKIWNFIDLLFAIYCVYKLIVTTFNVLLLQQNGSTDPITKMLSLMMTQLDNNNFEFKIDVSFWSQQLSFWFAGLIVFGSVRGFLKLTNRIFRVFMLKVTFSTSNILLFVAHIMGMYFLSSVLMMQMSLPTEYRYLISSSLQSVEFDFFRHWSDIIFIVSSIISTCIIYVIYQTHNPKSLATDFADMELMSIENGFDRSK